RSVPAIACALARSTSGLRNTATSRDDCTSPPRRARFCITTQSPSGKARATAITPTVSSVAHGLRNSRPRLATMLKPWWSSHAPNLLAWALGAACSFIGQVLGRDVVEQLAVVQYQHALLHALDQAKVVAGHQ